MSAFRDGQGTERPYDKIETTPTDKLAKCKLCMNKIQRGELRIRMNHLYRGYKWSPVYYHKTCVSTARGGASNIRTCFILQTDLTSSETEIANSIIGENEYAPYFKSQSSSKRKNISMEEQIEIEACYYEQQQQIRQTLIDSRRELRELLRSTRIEFSRQLNLTRTNYNKRKRKNPYCSIHDEMFETILDSLVEQMPLNQTELLTVPGFGRVRCATIGPVFLAVINRYKQRQIDQKSVPHQQQRQPVLPPTTNSRRNDNDNNNSDDDEVIVEHEVSIEELIKYRIKEAEERGEVIEL